MKQFEVEKIEVRKPRHTVNFSANELKEILKDYMRAQGASVPEGRTALWGLDNDSPDRSRRVTLCIDPD